MTVFVNKCFIRTEISGRDFVFQAECLFHGSIHPFVRSSVGNISLLWFFFKLKNVDLLCNEDFLLLWHTRGSFLAIYCWNRTYVWILMLNATPYLIAGGIFQIHFHISDPFECKILHLFVKNGLFHNFQSLPLD